MQTDFEKLAETFEAGSGFLNADEALILAAAVEVAIEKLGHFDIDEEALILVGAAVADAFLARS